MFEANSIRYYAIKFSTFLVLHLNPETKKKNLKILNDFCFNVAI